MPACLPICADRSVSFLCARVNAVFVVHLGAVAVAVAVVAATAVAAADQRCCLSVTLLHTA